MSNSALVWFLQLSRFRWACGRVMVISCPSGDACQAHFSELKRRERWLWALVSPRLWHTPVRSGQTLMSRAAVLQPLLELSCADLEVLYAPAAGSCRKMGTARGDGRHVGAGTRGVGEGGRHEGVLRSTRWLGGRWQTPLRRSGACRLCVMSCLLASGGAGKQLHSSSVEQVEQPPNAALDNLRADVGDDAATQFVAHYLALLDSRITGIGQSIEQGRIEPGITLLLTLETSSHMVGASGLCGSANLLRLALSQAGADTSEKYQALVGAAASARQSLTPT